VLPIILFRRDGGAVVGMPCCASGQADRLPIALFGPFWPAAVGVLIGNKSDLVPRMFMARRESAS